MANKTDVKKGDYEVTQESDECLKNFRMKLIELFILTLSALFILMTFSGDKRLLIPAGILILDIFIVILSLVIKANKNKTRIEFKDHTLLSLIKMDRLSYEFEFSEYLALGIYLLSIVSWGLFMFF